MHKIRGLFHSIALAWYHEPVTNYTAARQYLLGYRSDFKYIGLNPTLLADQETRNPTLLIHGNYHNQSAWLSCAKTLRERNYGPLFTVNLTHGTYRMRDRDLIDQKINAIKQQYAQINRPDIKINLVGHSRGAVMAFYMGIKPEFWSIDSTGQLRAGMGTNIWRDDIAYIIRLGHPTTEFEKTLISPDKKTKIYDIVASRDKFVREQSSLADTNCFKYNCGHLGLLYSSEVHQQISNILSSQSIG